MTVKEIKEKRAALVAEVEGATEERFAQIKSEIAKYDFMLEEARKSEETTEAEQREAEARAARDPNGGKEDEDPTPEQRGKKIVMFGGADSQTSEDKEFDKPTALRHAKSAFGKQVRAMLNKTEVNLNPNEKRALGIALTTTSENFIAPGADVDGVNNGGVFIPQNVLYDLLETDTPDSPFLRDVEATHIKGALIFPYVIEATPAARSGKKENEDADDRSIKWGKLPLAQGNYALTIEVTLELLAMTDEQFATHLLSDLSTEINYLLTDEVFYADGKNERIEGVTVGAIIGTAYAAGGEAAAIKTGLLALSRRARKGAKVYMSRSMALDMTFEKGEDGHYIFPIYNNAGITTIATIPVEVDENLNDGDFIIGNPKNYKLNFVKPVEVYPTLQGKKRVIEYTAHLMVAGKAAPKKFYYGKKA